MKRKSRETISDRVLYTIVSIVMIVITLIVLYPLIYVLSASFSSPAAVSAGRVILLPVEFSLKGYEAVFSYKNIMKGYANTILYTVVGTFINVTITMFCAYPLARKRMQWKKFYSVFFLITMYFGGGLIPTYILTSKLGLINTRTIMFIDGALSVYNMIVARTFLEQSIPGDLLDAAQIDGCNDYQYFFRVILPLSKAIIAVEVLFYAVAHWNSYFNAMIYLNDSQLYPLQLFLRQILIMNQLNPSESMSPEVLTAMKGMSELLKYSLIVISTAPIMFVYPFVQKYFTKGVMIGAVKG